MRHLHELAGRARHRAVRPQLLQRVPRQVGIRGGCGRARAQVPAVQDRAAAERCRWGRGTSREPERRGGHCGQQRCVRCGLGSAALVAAARPAAQQLDGPLAPTPPGPEYRALAPTRALVAALKASDFKAALAVLETGAVTELESFVDRGELLTPLLWSCKAASARPLIPEANAVAEALVAAGADVSVRCKRGYGPLYHAARLGYTSLIVALLDKGAKESAALDLLARACDPTTGGALKKREAILMRCIAGGDLAHLSASAKERILLSCCQNGYDAPAAALIAANVKWQVASTTTLLHRAAASGCIAAATALLDKGADMDALNALSQSPLHLACLRKRNAVALLLIARGAEKDDADELNMTPANYARIRPRRPRVRPRRAFRRSRSAFHSHRVSGRAQPPRQQRGGRHARPGAGGAGGAAQGGRGGPRRRRRWRW